MEQLLSIHNIPIKLDIKVEYAKLEVSAEPSQDTLHSTPQINVSQAADAANRDSIVLNNSPGEKVQPAEAGHAAAAKETKKINLEAAKIDLQQSSRNVDFDSRPVLDPNLEYVPGNIECTVEEYPHVEIEYIGGPIYVPPDSAPEKKSELDLLV